MRSNRRSMGLTGHLCCAAIVVFVGGLSSLRAEDAPKPAAGSAGEVVAQWADAIAAGNAEKAKSFIDQTTEGGRTYAAYIGEVARVRKSRLDLVARLRKSFGDAAADKADKMFISAASGVLESDYKPWAETLVHLKEGSKFYPPGSKTECVILRKGDKWLVDGSEVGRMSMEEEFKDYRDKLAATSKALDTVKSADEAVKAIAKICGVAEVP